jgi:hypothetical protein
MLDLVPCEGSEAVKGDFWVVESIDCEACLLDCLLFIWRWTVLIERLLALALPETIKVPVELPVGILMLSVWIFLFYGVSFVLV